jgi:hypothetical protein
MHFFKVITVVLVSIPISILVPLLSIMPAAIVATKLLVVLLARPQVALLLTKMHPLLPQRYPTHPWGIALL